jgi:hypothetical protein
MKFFLPDNQSFTKNIQKNIKKYLHGINFLSYICNVNLITLKKMKKIEIYSAPDKDKLTLHNGLLTYLDEEEKLNYIIGTKSQEDDEDQEEIRAWFLPEAIDYIGEPKKIQFIGEIIYHGEFYETAAILYDDTHGVKCTAWIHSRSGLGSATLKTKQGFLTCYF